VEVVEPKIHDPEYSTFDQTHLVVFSFSFLSFLVFGKQGVEVRSINRNVAEKIMSYVMKM
jgi:hypothetical protein